MDKELYYKLEIVFGQTPRQISGDQVNARWKAGNMMVSTPNLLVSIQKSTKSTHADLVEFPNASLRAFGNSILERGGD